MVFTKNDVATFFFWAGFHAQQSLTQASRLIFMETIVSGMDRQSERNYTAILLSTLLWMNIQMVCAVFEPLNTSMICVLSFLYSSWVSLHLNENFSFSTRQLCLFGWIFIFYCACNFEIKVDRNVWKYTEKYWNRTLEILWLQFNLGYTRQGSVLRLINFIIHYPDKCYLVVDHLPSRKLYFNV